MVTLNAVTVCQVKTFGNSSGYIYLHFPQWLCKQFEIKKGDVFAVRWVDGKLILEQCKENKNASQLGAKQTE
jgi:hypothetical protein